MIYNIKIYIITYNNSNIKMHHTQTCTMAEFKWLYQYAQYQYIQYTLNIHVDNLQLRHIHTMHMFTHVSHTHTINKHKSKTKKCANSS